MKRFICIVCFLCLTGKLLLQAQNWHSVGNGTQWYARCILADTTDNMLYIGGLCAYADTVRINGIGRWDGTKWLPVGRGDTMCTGGCPNPIVSIERFGGDIYAGGFFQTMGASPNTAYLARWDGTNWNSIGVANSQVNLKALNNKLYAMGMYSSIGGITAYSIASWDGTQWSDVNGFPNDPFGDVNVISAIEMFQGELYVGGSFNILNNRRNIAKWDGINWISLQNGIIGGLASVSTIVSYNNELYVGGWFTKSDGNAGNFLMVWNGNTWREFSPDINYGGPVTDIKIIDNQLYIIGAFNFVGDTAEYGMAKYDGVTFSAFGGANNWATSIAGLNNELYVITDNVIGSDTVHYVAQWMGGNLIDSSISVVAGVTNIEYQNFLSLYPNPATNQLTIEFDLIDNKNASIELKNILGQTAKKIVNNFSSGKNSTKIDISDLPKGLYFVLLQNGAKLSGQKIVKN